jgi:hypothetical protein
MLVTREDKLKRWLEYLFMNAFFILCPFTVPKVWASLCQRSWALHRLRTPGRNGALGLAKAFPEQRTGVKKSRNFVSVLAVWSVRQVFTFGLLFNMTTRNKDKFMYQFIEALSPKACFHPLKSLVVTRNLWLVLLSKIL